MRFAVQHGIGDPRWTPSILHPDEVARFVHTAERAGFDAVAFTDHPAPSAKWVEAGGEGVADALTSLAYCAAVSPTIGLLTWVLVPPFRNPFVTAHAVATVDRLSLGRLTLGLGTGYLRSELSALGVGLDERRERFEEAIAVMKQVWAGDDVSIETERYAAHGVRAVPRPVSQPHPPLWVHGNSRWGLDFAARSADGWIGMVTTPQAVRTIRTHGIADLDALARRIDDLAVACDAAGRSIDDITIAATGMWPMYDVQAGMDITRMRTDVRRLEAMGVDWVVGLVCGHDPDVSVTTLHRLGDELIAATR
jgi:probable F420-dependent oxidoreductase